MGSTLIHFVAEWAEAICAPHRIEVVMVAERLGLTLREIDCDQAAEQARFYGVMNVPAVAIEGRSDSLIVGALEADDLVERLKSFVN